jgi:hypothetical protein
MAEMAPNPRYTADCNYAYIDGGHLCQRSLFVDRHERLAQLFADDNIAFCVNSSRLIHVQPQDYV